MYVCEIIEVSTTSLPPGVQYRTKSGYACETWGSGVASSYTNPPYTTLAGAQNYCRNPYVAARLVWSNARGAFLGWEEWLGTGAMGKGMKGES